jgi:mono/diheme cytochrome c family protein
MLSLCYAMAQPAPAPAPTSAPAPAPGKQGGDVLPAGPGKALVLRSCVSCHDVSQVTAQRAGKDQWNKTVDKMIENGAILTDAEADTIVQYLSTNFGPAPAKTPATPAAPSAENPH